MIYTVGHIGSYYGAIEKYPGKVYKTGRHDDADNADPDYAGGIVFKTWAAAEDYLRKNPDLEYWLFGVDADWDKDVEAIDDYTGRLLYNRTIMPLDTIFGAQRRRKELFDGEA